MARTKSRGELRVSIGQAESEAADRIAGSGFWTWFAVFSVLAALLLALTWLPLARLTANYQINYNEGWNSYWQQLAAAGGHVYGQAPSYAYANYPPLSFYLVGLVGRVFGDTTLAGRWISLLAFIALAASSGLTIRRLTGSRRCGALTAALLAIFIATIKPDRIGMNDPHLLGMAFVALGVYAYVRAGASPMWLRLSAIAFVIGLYTKQSLIAFPLAVAIHLWLNAKKQFGIWVAAGAASGIALLVFSFTVGGSHFLEHLALPRAYSYAVFSNNMVWYLLIMQAAVVVGLVWCFGQKLSGGMGLLVISYALTHAFALWFSAGEGADLNHMYDPLVAIALIAGAAVPYAVWAAGRVRFGPALLAVLLTLPFTLGTLTMLPAHMQEDLNTHRAISVAERDFAATVDFLKSHPGPALCENLLACYEAGRPLDYDIFVMDQLVKTGKTPANVMWQVFDQRRFTVVQLDIAASEPVSTAPRLRTSTAFLDHLLKNYQVAKRGDYAVFFTPKQVP